MISDGPAELYSARSGFGVRPRHGVFGFWEAVLRKGRQAADDVDNFSPYLECVSATEIHLYKTISTSLNYFSPLKAKIDDRWQVLLFINNIPKMALLTVSLESYGTRENIFPLLASKALRQQFDLVVSGPKSLVDPNMANVTPKLPDVRLHRREGFEIGQAH